jgi:hypothetical protein
MYIYSDISRQLCPITSIYFKAFVRSNFKRITATVSNKLTPATTIIKTVRRGDILRILQHPDVACICGAFSVYLLLWLVFPLPFIALYEEE